MATVWTICGAGRGVGKTRLALALCEVLPKSVYAKLGATPAKDGKPSNYFRSENELARFVESACGNHEHVVAESNAWARGGKGDVIVFVDGPVSGHGVRADVDQFRANSHIHISRHATIRAWKRALGPVLGTTALRDKVCDVLADQKRFAEPPEIAVRTKVWFEAESEHAFGAGLAVLLENVERLGTLTEAARAARISYRRAWDLIRRAEKHMGQALIIRRSGGEGGGASVVSPYGRQFLKLLRQVSGSVEAYADDLFTKRLQEEFDGQI